MRVRASEVFALMVLLWGAVAGAQQRQHLLPLSPEERAALSKRLDPALLPAGASHRNVDPKQTFKLVGPRGVELSVAAVDFDVPNPNAGVRRQTCGMYVVPAHGATYFLDGTNSDEQLPVQCWGITSVRLVRKGAEPPDIVFVGEDSLTSHSWLQEYVLSRSEDGSYKLSVDYKYAP
jgi:hypothetical protein